MDPGFSFSQAEPEGDKPGENTQGRVTSDPTAAYTLVLSLDGWTIPVRECKRRIQGHQPDKNLNQSASCLVQCLTSHAHSG